MPGDADAPPPTTHTVRPPSHGRNALIQGADSDRVASGAAGGDDRSGAADPCPVCPEFRPRSDR